ncbi:MAG: AAA family ATPase [Bacteroidetes bacterium HGW-Bacteroidetes-10]|nr:MAG: AAA family ATPase [Bacteroidetes bacterium HGW-Bacteroidetes-10]
MENLFSVFRYLISRTELGFVRYLYSTINWNNRLIAIVGARGVGKTTMLFQHIKLNYDVNSQDVLYASLDNLWFANHSLLELADEFHKSGGKALFFDEVHKYKGWSREIKNIYDSYPQLKIVFTGSSMLDIHKSGGDLSRRAVKYTLRGMSLREYIEYEHGIKLEPLSLEDLLTNHIAIATETGKKIRPVSVFKEYVRSGYFPYYKEDKEGYHNRVMETINTIIEVDLPANLEIEYSTIIKIKRLFSIIATSVPFKPNISKLAEQVGTTRPSLLNFLEALNRAQAILILDKEAQGLKRLVKPEKVYLGNTNYAYAISGESADIGNVRETFFYSMVSAANKVSYSDQTDFIVDGHYNFEIGGKDKGQKQLSGLKNGFVAKDNIETGTGNQIPLWMFGMLY